MQLYRGRNVSLTTYLESGNYPSFFVYEIRYPYAIAMFVDAQVIRPHRKAGFIAIPVFDTPIESTEIVFVNLKTFADTEPESFGLRQVKISCVQVLKSFY